MLKNILEKKVSGFEVSQNFGSTFVIRRVHKGKIILQIGTVLYLLTAVFISVLILSVYFRGAKIFDGNEMPLWFVSVFLLGEWLTVIFLLWFSFSIKYFAFDYKSFEIRHKNLGFTRKGFSIVKHKIQKVLLISQSDDSLICTLKVQTGDREQKILWLQPYEQCQWLGTVIATWAQVPLEE